MQLTLIDHNVSMTMNVFITIANIINLIYNIPQVVKTMKTKSTKDFSSWFIFLRIVGSIIWVAYAIDIDNLPLLVNTFVTVVASLIIGYYKALELYRERKDINNTPADEESLISYEPIQETVPVLEPAGPAGPVSAPAVLAPVPAGPVLALEYHID